MTKAHIKRELKRFSTQLVKLEDKKNQCVNNQFKMEDEDKTHLAKYDKLIDLDFDLAEKIKDTKRLINNLNARLKKAK